MLHKVIETHLDQIGASGGQSDDHAGLFELDEKFDGAWRVGRSWDQPPQVGWVNEGDIRHTLPDGYVGTNNLDMPPLLAQQMQKLRDGSINPNELSDVREFQRVTADALQLFLPLVIGKVIESYHPGATAKAEVMVDFDTPEGKLTLDYATALSHVQRRGHMPYSHSVKTIGGSTSVADVSPLVYNSLEVRISGLEGVPIDWRFGNIMRGGLLPSLIGKYMVLQAGMKGHIESVKADRTNADGHYSEVTGASLIEPHGYVPSEHSRSRDGWIGPAEPKENGYKQVHLFIDPMLATGSSGEYSGKSYMDLNGCSPKDLWFVSLFTGAYGGIERLANMGSNLITLAHDQPDLTSNRYIQPGLGDAGDKLSGEGVKDAHQIISSMYHLADSRPGFRAVLDRFAYKLLGQVPEQPIPELRPTV